MSGLKVSDSLSLPLNAVTQTFACIGRRGSGKTYLATMLAEQMLDALAQVIVLDPVGNWYGLRIAADGKSKGKDIFVMGGEHGDVPLPSKGGARIGRLLAEKNVSAVIDISGFRQGERKRFAADFAEEFFHLKKSQRSAVHIFIEEAQLFIPQMCRPDEARMLGAFENIVRLGRNYGIGATLISQRPQSVNKEVLSQVECLCVLQVNGTHERKALDAWVQEAGADRKLVGELPGLARGEGYVWSPAWLRVFQRVRFAKKATFDTSATPEVGRAAQAAMLSAVDVEALKGDLQDVIAEAEKDDPNALRRQIAELRKQSVSSPAVDHRALDEARTRVSELEREVQEWRGKYTNLRRIVTSVQAQLPAEDQLEGNAALIPVRTAPRIIAPASPKSRPIVLGNGVGQPMPRACRSILTALAQHGECSKPKVAALTGYAINGGGFNNALSECRTKGWMAGSDPLSITSDGVRALGEVQPLPSGEQLLAMWNAKLGKAEREILTALVENGELTKERVADLTGYVASGGGFNNALSRLRTLELIEGKGCLRVTPDFAEAVSA